MRFGRIDPPEDYRELTLKIITEQRNRPTLEGIKEGAGQKCMVCKLELKDEQDIIYCPYCKGPAHISHLLEWVHMNGTCPICQMRLKEDDMLPKHFKRQYASAKETDKDFF
jgi:hypothetical protein